MRYPTPGLDPAGALNDWQQQAKAPEADWSYYSCKLVTPLYGGGVRAGEVDEAMPIRAAGLRGQLRFWWRIACGPFASSEAMFQRESAIWGGISSSGPTASKVAVRVKAKPATPQQQSGCKQLPDFPSYALILDPGANPNLLRAEFTFHLCMRLDPKLDDIQRQEVQAALRWWASFGGVGARTRRGLGAVRVQELDPISLEEVEAKGGQLLLRDAERDAAQAWKRSVERLSQFRQGEGIGRNQRQPGEQSPGRSFWPEPDTIRLQSGRHAARHAPEHSVKNAFPRAVFGLPIVFHFKDPGEPGDHTLEPKNPIANVKYDRMASPLILRPYWDGKSWRPAALLIPRRKEALNIDVGFKNGPPHRAWPRDRAERAERAAQIKPMAGRGDDPLSAFMAYFQED